MVPELRCRVLVDAPAQPDGQYVLYWMIANRRAQWNFSLERAIEWAAKLGKPLLILEALRTNYPWHSDRFHQFILEGMADNQALLDPNKITYYPYVEPTAGAGSGLVESLAKRAAVIVTDDFPCFFLPAMLRAVQRLATVRVEAVDSNGLLPMRAAPSDFPTAYAFRRFLQRSLRPHLESFPKANPFARVKLAPPIKIDAAVRKRWPAVPVERLSSATARTSLLTGLPIDHTVPPSMIPGGSKAAHRTLETFLNNRLARYGEDRNHPDEAVASELSPYLHFGHISTHQVVHELLERENWDLGSLSQQQNGSREGWWGVGANSESFLDELVTWRELGFNFCSHRRDYDRYRSLPDWAQVTLAQHASDPRPWTYSLDEFAQAGTHDELWNAAQNQLVVEGRIHNYLRMLWGKKILEWTPSPEEALSVMIELNNRYALDGRDPNSYSGIFWVLGRYDRPWGPERPIYGKIRYMTSDNTRRKCRLSQYLVQHGRDNRETPLFSE